MNTDTRKSDLLNQQALLDKEETNLELQISDVGNTALTSKSANAKKKFEELKLAKLNMASQRLALDGAMQTAQRKVQEAEAPKEPRTRPMRLGNPLGNCR